MTTIEMKVKNMISDLNNSEQIAASYFLRHKEHIYTYPLAKLAEMSGTSQGAWSRFCKRIGFDGIKGLKNALYQETNQSSGKDSTPDRQFSDIQEFSSISLMAEHLCASSVQALETTMQLLDVSVMEQAVELLISARLIHFFGIGASGLVAQDLCSKFLRIGYHAIYQSDLHLSYSHAATSTPEDVAVIISNSGETEEIIRILEILKSVPSPAIAITCYNDSSLAQAADYCLFTNSTEILKRSGATTSRIAALYMADVLFMATAHRDYTNIEKKLESSYVSCHPTFSRKREAAP